jgi:hypothetical protein
MKDVSRFLGCESPEEKRERCFCEKREAEQQYERAKAALEDFERQIFQDGTEETDEIRARLAELRAQRQAAYNEMRERKEAFFFAERVTRVEKSTRPPAYRRDLDRRDGSWVKR